MATAQDVIDRVRHLINDEVSTFVSGLRWSDTEMLQWITDGQREAVKLKPEVNQVAAMHTVVADPMRQRLSQTVAYKLIRVEANQGATGAGVVGSAIRTVERDALDSFNPQWMTTSSAAVEGSRYKHCVMDATDPLAFWLCPRPAAGHDVLVVYAGIPAIVAAAVSTLTLSDMYVPVLADYAAYRALAKESRAGAADHAETYLNRFLIALGAQRQIIRQVGQNANMPPNAEA